jgi:hypothetical protein
MIKLGLQYLRGENLKVVWAKFSTLRWTVLVSYQHKVHATHAATLGAICTMPYFLCNLEMGPEGIECLFLAGLFSLAQNVKCIVFVGKSQSQPTLEGST